MLGAAHSHIATTVKPSVQPVALDPSIQPALHEAVGENQDAPTGGCALRKPALELREHASDS